MEFTSLVPHRALLKLTGSDRRPFLQGLISNDIQLCVADSPIYAALLTPQGKFSHDMFIVEIDDAFWIECEGHRADPLAHKLSSFKLRAKILIEDMSADYQCLVTWGEPLSASPVKDLPTLGRFRDPRLPSLGTRSIVTKDQPLSGVTVSPYADFDRFRLSLGVPEARLDMLIGTSTLLECNMDRLHAISWTKGCYVGQELTARMHYRALLKKRLFPVRAVTRLPEPATRLVAHGVELGEMRSQNDGIGLALLSIEAATRAIEAQTPLVLDTGLEIRVEPLGY